MATVLYIVDNLYCDRYGAKHIVGHFNDPYTIFSGSTRLAFACDYIIKFTEGKHFYLKNRHYDREPYTEKQLAWMLLKAKDYGSIKAN